MGKRTESDAGARDGVTTIEAQRWKDLESEVRELPKVNEVLKLASPLFPYAQFDRGIKSRRA